MHQKEIINEISLTTVAMLAIGGLGALIIGIILTMKAIADEYIEILGLLFGILCGSFGVVCLGSIFFLEKILFKQDKLVVESILGFTKQVIKVADIKNFKEIEKRNKYKKWKDLTLFTHDAKYKISSHSNKNYELLKKKLTSGKKKNVYAEKLWHYNTNRRIGLGVLFLGLVLLFVFGILENNRVVNIKSTDLTQIKGIVANKIEIEKSGKGNRSHSIGIRLKEYPKFRFKLRDNGIRFTRTNELIANTKIGEHIYLDILLEQFKKKLTKEIPMSTWDKGINSRIINIYGIKDNDNSYFNLDAFNDKLKKDNDASFLLISSMLLISCGLYKLIINTKPAANKR